MSSSQLQGSGFTQTQPSASGLGGSSATLQSGNLLSTLQQESTANVSVVGEKTEPYRDGSVGNIVILFVIAVVAVAGVVLWFRDSK